MTNQNPATPAQAATPGNGAAVPPNPSAATPAPQQGNQGNQSEGKVTIDLKEYRDLQRAKARTLSFDKRAALRNGGGSAANPGGDGVSDEVAQANARAAAAERKAMQGEVREKVRGLLDQDEFKAIPKSTKELILRNPAMLSQAETLDEAIIDIEEFLRDQVIGIDSSGGGQSNPAPAGSAAPQPKGHDTPPAPNAGGPAPAKGDDLEDLTKLKGADRSRAAIRNAMKSARKK